MQSIKKSFYSFRRVVLKNFVPEFIWPKHILMDGVDIPIRNMSFSFGTKRALLKGAYESAERQLLSDQLKPKDIVIEMGGSIGVLTAIISNYVGKEGKVVSVEASEPLTKVSKRWLSKMGNIEVLAGFGFPIFKGSKNLSVNNFTEYGGSLGGVVSFSNDTPVDENVVNKIWDIQTICNKFNIKPTVLVLDIEGSEKILVDHTPDFPSSIRMILIELHPWMYNGHTTNAIIKRIESEGFYVIKTIKSSYLFIRN